MPNLREHSDWLKPGHVPHVGRANCTTEFFRLHKEDSVTRSPGAGPGGVRKSNAQMSST